MSSQPTPSPKNLIFLFPIMVQVGAALPDNGLYGVKQMVAVAQLLGLLAKETKHRSKQRARLRFYFTRIATAFPQEGDGSINFQEHVVPGWTAQRWKQALSTKPAKCTTSLYHPLLTCLAPDWSYSQPSICHFLIQLGLTELLGGNAPEPVNPKRLLKRIQSALELLRRLREMGNLMDPMIRLVGRARFAWWGWRWQGYTCLEEAIAAERNLLSQLPHRLTEEATYSFSQVLSAVCEPVALAEAPILPGRPVVDPGQLQRIWVQRVLLRHALALGLDPLSPQPGSAWLPTQSKTRDSAVEVFKRFGHLKPKQTYTLAEVVAVPLANGFTGADQEQAERALLYALAWRNGFPEFGDAQRGPDKIPAWLGSRWSQDLVIAAQRTHLGR